MKPILITAEGFIDVESMSVRSKPCLLVEDDRIVRIFSRSELGEGLADVELIELPGHYLLPGLINFHAHVCLPGNGTTIDEAGQLPYEMLVIRAVRNLSAELMSGVTTLRDCGGRPAVLNGLKQAMSECLIRGPRLFHSGEMITMTGGHCHPIGIEADGPDEVAQAVREQFKQGADFVKLMATGGGTRGTHPAHASFSVRELASAAETAHRIDKRVAAHCRGTAGMINAIEAGIDFMEHASFEQPDGRLMFDGMIAERLAQVRISVTPTIRLHQDALEWLQKVKDERELTPAEEKRLAHLPQNVEEKLRSLEGLRRAGVTILAGNDAGVPQTGFGEFWKELEMMTRGGMSPMEAIAAATIEPARAMGMDREVGSLRPGKKADIVAVAGDPSREIARLQDVVWVMKEGRLVRRP